MNKEFEFKCSCCGDVHKGMPTFGNNMPLAAYYVPEDQRNERVDSGDSDCVIDEESFFLRGCIEIKVQEYNEPFIWGAWVDISKENFIEYVTFPEEQDRTSLGPYYGYLSAHFSPYEEECEGLRVRLHPRENGIRPYIELEPTDHPLAVEQQQGILVGRLEEIYKIMVHSN